MTRCKLGFLRMMLIGGSKDSDDGGYDLFGTVSYGMSC